MDLGFLDILCILLVVAGLIFFLGAAAGLLRFPDFYTRMHAAGKGDTLSTLLIMAGAGLYEFNKFDPAHGVTISVVFIIIKIMTIGLFIMLTSPTSTHVLMKAGYDGKVEPVGDSAEMKLEMPPLRDAPTSDPSTPTPSPPRRLKD